VNLRIRPRPTEVDPVAAAVRRSTDTPIGDVGWRQPATVVGRVRSVRIQPWGGAPTLECILVDETGGMSVVFLGRRRIDGIRPGCRMRATGIVGAHDGRLAILNPVYELEPTGG